MSHAIDTSDATRDQGAIQQVVQNYIEAVRTPRSHLWRQAFHPEATIVNDSRGTDDIQVWTIADSIERVQRLRGQVGTVPSMSKARLTGIRQCLERPKKKALLVSPELEPVPGTSLACRRPDPDLSRAGYKASLGGGR
jgi:hypothetical protein